MGAKASLLVLFVLCVIFAIARSDRALTSAAGRDIEEITFWNGFTGPDGRVMLGLVREFNQTDGAAARVTMQRIPWATYYNKLMVSALDGRGPEVFVIQASMLPRMQRAGFIDQVNDLFGPHLELKGEYTPALLRMVNFGAEDHEQFFGLPLDVWPQGLYCNTEMLKKIGFVNGDGSARPPRNREEFLQAAEALKIDADGDGRPEQWGFGFGAWNLNFLTLVPQFGGKLIDEHGQPTLDDPGNIEALQFLTDLLQKYHVAPPPEGGVAGWIGFRQQRVAQVFDGIYMLGDLKRLEGHPYTGAPIPQIGPYPGTYADSHVLCIRKNLGDSRRAAAARFIRFLSDHSLQWADAGQVPARKSVRECEAFKHLQVQYAFSTQLDHVMFPPKTPSIAEITLHINLAFEKAIRGRASPADALHQANADYKRYLERDRMERELATRAGAGGRE